MPTIVGTDTITSISNRIVMPVITDQVYGSVALLWRLNGANKKRYAGGTHLEAPFITAIYSATGEYQGYDLLDVTPEDNIKNGGWDMKEYYASMSLSGRDIARANSPQAIASLIDVQWSQARMGLSNKLGTDIWGSAVSNSKKIDGLQDAVDDGGVATSYAGLTRAANTYLNCTDDSTTATLTLSALRSLVSSATKGGHSPTIIFSRKEQYNRYWALLQPFQRFPTEGMRDEQLAAAGFKNLLFDQIPWVLDDKCFDGPNTSNSAIVALNEEYIDLAIFNGVDFAMQPFRVPTNQNAMVGLIFWYGNVVHTAPQTSGKLTNISA